MWSDRRPLLVLGACSLLVNIFLVGLLFGRGTAPEHRPIRPQGGGNVAFLHLSAVRQLDKEDRQRFHAAMAAHRPAIKEARDALRQQRQRVEADMRAPTFDRDKVSDDLRVLRQVNETVVEQVHAALLDAVGGLPPAAREALLQPHRPAGEGAPNETPATAPTH